MESYHLLRLEILVSCARSCVHSRQCSIFGLKLEGFGIGTQLVDGVSYLKFQFDTAILSNAL